MRALASLLLVIAISPMALPAQPITDVEVTPFERLRTQRLLEDRLACLGCHRLGSVGGAIGPSFDGLSERADFDYVLRMISEPSVVLPGTLMPRQPMPEREARRLAAYLLGAPNQPSVPPAPMQATSALPAGAEQDGAALYARHCAACHGGGGNGDGWNAANLPVPPTAHADADLMSQRADDTLYDGIAAGGFVLDKSHLMPAFGELLSPAQIRALVAHIRDLCACEGPPWSRHP